MRLRKRNLTPDASGAPSYDMSFGQGAADYWRDVPDAPAQLVYERLNLWMGDWFLDTSDGMPWRNDVLGRNTDASRDRAVRARILATQGVTGITAYTSALNRDTRRLANQVTVSTAYGTKTVPATVVPANADVRLYR